MCRVSYYIIKGKASEQTILNIGDNEFNQIEDIDVKNAFKDRFSKIDLKQLDYFHLRSWQLTTLNKESVHNLPSKTILYIDDNKFNQITDEDVKNALKGCFSKIDLKKYPNFNFEAWQLNIICINKNKLIICLICLIIVIIILCLAAKKKYLILKEKKLQKKKNKESIGKIND